jgi:hypothetical protein
MELVTYLSFLVCHPVWENGSMAMLTNKDSWNRVKGNRTDMDIGVRRDTDTVMDRRKGIVLCKAREEPEAA